MKVIKHRYIISTTILLKSLLKYCAVLKGKMMSTLFLISQLVTLCVGIIFLVANHRLSALSSGFRLLDGRLRQVYMLLNFEFHWLTWPFVSADLKPIVGEIVKLNLFVMVQLGKKFDGFCPSPYG
jgi:hypothetical protein